MRCTLHHCWGFIFVLDIFNSIGLVSSKPNILFTATENFSHKKKAGLRSAGWQNQWHCKLGHQSLASLGSVS